LSAFILVVMHGGHDHAHDHAPESFGWRFALATALNVALIIGQVWYGFAANSLALLADAGHNFGDVLGLVMAWAAFALADWKPSDRYTYRMHAASILSAFGNGLLLIVAVGAIAYEAVQRFFDPQPVATMEVIAVAALAIVVNGFSAWLLSSGSRSDLNIRGAFLHMVADAGVSVAVVLAAVGIMLTAWEWLDPAASLAISVVILWSTWNLLREAIRLSLNAAPREIEPPAVESYLTSLPEVASVHDLHIWAMSTRETALTCHLVTPAGHPGDAFLRRVADELRHRFSIEHPTLQIELADSGECPLRCELPV
jgi:cobalt-zinc-cadmium efflux system protein